MKTNDFRKMMASIFQDYNFYFGDNVGEFGEHNYKINYQIKSTTYSEGERIYSIDIDIYHQYSIGVDDLSDEIETLLNYQSFNFNKWGTFIFQNKYSVDERNMYRRALTYEVRTYQED